MPQVRLSDLGIATVDDPDASLGGYLLQQLRLAIAPGGLSKLKAQLDQPLNKVELVGARAGLLVSESSALGEDGTVAWNVQGGASADFGLWSQPGDTVLSAQKFGPDTAIKVAEGGAYVSFAFRGQVGTGPSVEQGNLSFGVMGSGSIEAAYYQPLAGSASLRDGLTETLQRFVIPARLADLEKLTPMAVASVSGNGRVEFSVSGSLSTVPNPLAVSLPVVNTPLSVQAGGSVSFTASAAFVGEYEVRVVGLGDGQVSLGLYRATGGSFDISITASAGVKGGVGDLDLAPLILGAVTGRADVDREFLRNAGLSASRIDDLRATVRAAVNRKLAASLEAGFGALKMGGPAFLFTIKLDALDDAAKAAVSKALKGDFRAITSGELAGVRRERSIAHESVKESSRFRLNLFGLFNYDSLFTMLRESQEVYDETTGELLFLDKATAKRRESWIDNTRRLSTERVVSLLADTVVIALTFAATAGSAIEASLRIEHWYFQMRRQAKPADVKDAFDAAAALGLAEDADSEQILQRERFGRLALLAETSYNTATARSVFLTGDGQARPRKDFEQIGRRALLLLEQDDPDDRARALLGSNDKLYRALVAAGSHQAAMNELANVLIRKRPIPETMREAMYTDYLAIEWWADSMAALAETLAELRGAQDPAASRKKLQDRLADVVSKTKPLFGEPWGLVAMFLASGSKAGAHVRITSDEFVFDRSQAG